MKNRIVRGMTLLTIMVCATACGASQQEAEQTEVEWTAIAETQQSQNTDVISEMSLSEESTQEADLTFEDLSHYSFKFSSGAGAWSTELTIEKDGYFHGLYHDSDMGVIGEGYENGTVYISVFSGHFTDLTKTDDTVWTMKLADISYQDTIDETQIDTIDQIRYIYTGAYGLGTAMQVYWIGTPTADLSEDEMSWIGNADGDSTLTMPVLADETTGEAFYSYERQTPYEEAETALYQYQSSYDALEEILQQETTQGEMNLYAQKMYENSDDCLNEIWNLVRYNTEENVYSAILEEQRAWIAEKDATEKSIHAEWGGGSGEPLAVYSSLAEMTMERCKVLTGYLAE